MTSIFSNSIAQSISQPSSEDLVIWRYMDFTKFVALLETRSLFFARITCLDDPFEGSFPVSQTPLDRILGMLPQNAFPEGARITISPSPGLEDHWKVMRNWAMVSCWHALAHESAAMWKLYAPTSVGVAIRSTVGRLRQALGTPSPPPKGFFGGDRYHIGMVDYIDFSSSRISTENAAAQFFQKRQSFEYEHELRALFMQWPIKTDGWFDHDQRPNDAGQQFPVDLETLIYEIRVAPMAPKWYLNLVTKMVERYGISVEPIQSQLDETPIY